MGTAYSGYAMGKSPSVQSVKIRKEWEDAIEQAKEKNKVHFNTRVFSSEESAFIEKARDSGIGWKEICRIISCNEATARKEWLRIKGTK
jgi:hypothetical protein